ncbi:collagen alpha-1(I) chain-like [Phalacrocorax carbo]|uniref:collagen alpha-1(I) chain-like n=1 Tax=Phalacrocorax carbo TaxID=9209 RepID=UPI003119C678
MACYISPPTQLKNTLKPGKCSSCSRLAEAEPRAWRLARSITAAGGGYDAAGALRCSGLPPRDTSSASSVRIRAAAGGPGPALRAGEAARPRRPRPAALGGSLPMVACPSSAPDSPQPGWRCPQAAAGSDTQNGDCGLGSAGQSLQPGRASLGVLSRTAQAAACTRSGFLRLGCPLGARSPPGTRPGYRGSRRREDGVAWPARPPAQAAGAASLALPVPVASGCEPGGRGAARRAGGAGPGG